MKPITYSYQKGTFFCSLDWYEKNERHVKNELKSYIYDINDNQVTIQSVQKLKQEEEPPTTLSFIVQGEKKQEKSCSLCIKRIQCLTRKVECSGFKHIPAAASDVSSFLTYLSDTNYPCLYVKVDAI